MSDPAVFPERARVAVPCACALGEGVIWDHRAATLIWVDITAPALFAWRPAEGGDPLRYAMPDTIGFAALTPDPDVLLVGLRRGVARFDRRNGSLDMLVTATPETGRPRLNDGCAGPDGSLYFGTADDAETQADGRFHHWSKSGLSTFGAADVVTNGPALDPARGCVYATRTLAGEIDRHPLDALGRPGTGELFVRFQPGLGHPDGMAVDAEGHVWVCHFGGARITRFAPDGTPVLIVPMPTGQITKAAFGGPNLSTLYVTSAARGRDREVDPFAGDVFALEVGIRGLPAPVCTMGQA